MILSTRLFGEIEINEEKIITFETGIIGFEELRKFTLIHEAEKETKSILWMQCIDNPEVALPVLNPLIVKEDYNPIVEDEIIKSLGDIVEEQIFVLVTVAVPSDVKKMTVNLKGPIIINPFTLKACQVIVENEEYLVKYPIYDILKANEKKDGE